MSTALYRRYRPETFADVIGQEHVTEPLMAAIDKDRINHAYLFSGPRGCGKTTSARILARCLNCAQGPTSTPCGTCDSCVELARNGSGSLDVIEIDAASHGGVDDARDLRERATFAPVRDRFKIFIIDEAHMVTSAGFNALLKIVEEPPEHILFIFATTEPDKVIGTIRSRTHHYPFRLVPPEPLMAYLELLCRQENVPVAPGVLSLVIRAGGGSVRDSLSVLDQLMAGAGENGLDYELAVSLLGYTHATLLDDVVESVAAGDAATVFNAVDRVIQTGHDPRRFVEDLLERFRDLIVINAVPEGAASILRGVPDDQLNRMRTQANQLGAGELSRAADVTNTALTEMTGATSPRLHLELLCARLLLPAADATARGTLARVDRIERRLEYAAGTPASEATEADEAPKAPARPRLDVPRTAEEAAARWSLPTADPVAPAVPAAVPGAHSPAVPAAAPAAHSPAVPAAVPGAHSPAVPAAGRTQPPATADSSPDWGGSWGVSTNSAFSDPAPVSTASERASERSSQPAPERSSENTRGEGSPAQPSPNEPVAPTPDRQPGAVAPQGLGNPAQAGRPAATTYPDQVPPPMSGANHMPQTPAAPARGPATVQHGQPQQDVRRPDAAQHGQPQQDVRRPDAVQQGQPAASGGNVEMVRRAWPEIMDEVAQIKRATWLIVNVTAKPRSFEGNQLVLAFSSQGNAIGFQRGPHMDNLKQAIHKVLGLTCSIEAVHDAGGSGESGPKVPAAPGSNPGSVSPVAPADRDFRPSAGDRLQAPVGADSRPTAGVIAGAGGSTSGGGAVPTSSAPVTRPVEADVRPAQPQNLTAAGNAGPNPAVRPGAGDNGPQFPVTPAQADTAGSSVESLSESPGESFGESTGGASVAARHPQAPLPAATTSAGRRRVSAETQEARTTARPGAASRPTPDPAQAEAVGAWDPTMSDDSWALVEPPEEAFDPGSDWSPAPEDPFDRELSGQQGVQAARPNGVAGSARDRGTTAPDFRPQRSDSSSAVPSPSAPVAPQRPAVRNEPAPSTGQPSAQAPTADSSRSVVWSPPVSKAPEAPQNELSAARPGGAPSTGGATSAAPMPSAGDLGRGGSTSAMSMTAHAAAPASAAGSASTTGSPVPFAGQNRGAVAPDRPATAENVRQKPVSRYQQLLDEAERKRAEEAAAARGAVDLRFVEDEPSADDETIEESGLVGRTAIERILNGRLVEERSVDGQ